MSRAELAAVRLTLGQWGRTEERLAALQEEMRWAGERIEALYNVGGVRTMDGQPRSTVPGDPVFRTFESVERQKELFRKLVEDCEAETAQELAFKAAVDQALKKLPSDQQRVVRMRYGAGGRTWTYVAIMLEISESNARLKEQRACEKLAEIIGVK